MLDNEVDLNDSIACLNKLLIADKEDERRSSPSAKKLKPNIANESSEDENFLQKFVHDNEKRAKIVPVYSFEEFASLMNSREGEGKESDGKQIVTEKILINALLHPNTIEQIKKVLIKENMNKNF